MNLKEYIKEKTLILDGAMGTYFSEKFRDYTGPCEMANIDAPDYVLQIHREYIKAGADAIKTNTFSVNPLNDVYSGDRFEEVIRAGIRLAEKAAEETEREISVFADIGPSAGTDPEQRKSALEKMCRIYIEQGSGILFLRPTVISTGSGKPLKESGKKWRILLSLFPSQYSPTVTPGRDITILICLIRQRL